MTRALLNDNVLEKVASLALGCCIAGGVIAVSPVAAPVVAGAVSLGTVLTVLGLRRLIREKPECEKALVAVRKALARDLIAEREADEAEVGIALAAFDAALRPDLAFTPDALADALAREARVVPALTAHVLAGMAGRDARFAPGAGLARDLAERILSAAFGRAVEACPPFKDRANLVLGEVTLTELRGLDARMAAGFAESEANADRRQAEIEANADRRQAELLAALSAGGLRRAEADGLSRTQVEALLRAFAYEGVSIDQAEPLLLQAAAELAALKQGLARLPNDAQEIGTLLSAATSAIDRADFAGADGLLAKAEEIDLEEGRRQVLRAAHTMADRAILARSQARLSEAAEHFGRAAGIVAGVDPEAAWSWRMSQGYSLEEASQIYGLATLNDAVDAYVAASALLDRNEFPDRWAINQHRLAAVKLDLCRGGDARKREYLNEAEDHFLAALEVRRKEIDPVGWIETTLALANLLLVRVNHPDGEVRSRLLARAMDLFREVEESFSGSLDKPSQGSILIDIGKALGKQVSLRKDKYDEETQKSAIDYLRRGVELMGWEHEKLPQIVLANTLRSHAAHLRAEKAVFALKHSTDILNGCLRLLDPVTSRYRWLRVTTYRNLSMTYYGVARKDAAMVRRAIADWDTLFSREAVGEFPGLLMKSLHYRGNAYLELEKLSPRNMKRACLDKAVSLYEEALAMIAVHPDDDSWARTNGALTRARLARSRLPPASLES